MADIPPHMNPMTDAEVRELLSATLHGPLPQATVQRLLATVARDVEERRAPLRAATVPAMAWSADVPAGTLCTRLVGAGPEYGGKKCCLQPAIQVAADGSTYGSYEGARRIARCAKHAEHAVPADSRTRPQCGRTGLDATGVHTCLRKAADRCGGTGMKKWMGATLRCIGCPDCEPAEARDTQCKCNDPQCPEHGYAHMKPADSAAQEAGAGLAIEVRADDWTCMCGRALSEHPLVHNDDGSTLRTCDRWMPGIPVPKADDKKTVMILNPEHAVSLTHRPSLAAVEAAIAEARRASIALDQYLRADEQSQAKRDRLESAIDALVDLAREWATLHARVEELETRVERAYADGIAAEERAKAHVHTLADGVTCAGCLRRIG